MTGMILRVIGAVAAALLLLGPALPTNAHDHRPPGAELRYGSLLQDGRLIRQRWSAKTDDGGCVSSLVAVDAAYPRPGLPVGAGRFRAALRLSRPDRPTDLTVVARQGGGPGDPRPGERRGISATLRPRRAGGDVIGWAAVLASRVEDHLYLRVTGSWDDRQGCLGAQKATWLFHITAG